MPDWIVVVIVGAIIAALITASIVSGVRRKKAAEQMLTQDPYLPLIFTRIGLGLKDAVAQGVGVSSTVQVAAVDDKAAPTMVTAQGQFTPVTPGPHKIKLLASGMTPGIAKKFTTGEITLNLARGQRVLVDLHQGQWRVQDL